MRTTIPQLRRTIRRVIAETFEPKGYGWDDFKMMASEGNYEGCAMWIEDMLRGMNQTPAGGPAKHQYSIDNESVYGLIEYASDETVTSEELQTEFNAMIGVRE